MTLHGSMFTSDQATTLQDYYVHLRFFFYFYKYLRLYNCFTYTHHMFSAVFREFVKPTVVNEIGTRASSASLISSITLARSLAPSDINLSIVYEQCLNNLIPGVPTSAINFQKQRSQICDWLLKDERVGQGSHRSSAHHGYYC